MIKVIVHIVSGAAMFILGIVAFGLLLSLPVMLLWNWCLVPAVTILKPIGWFQAWGILFVCGALFKTRITNKTSK